ncbi:hypothetical protein Acr_00g0058730 [Actinidia rufa]|uniref:Plant basic secretory protein (BSP) family protein n=1 Tax=Actinidia rufa TaxID=165716 RepID=A0A7J0DPY9_9ERIC|nr:hypothetical protein Acr_00g0058730 [Actinidia rufa]
MEDQHLHLLLRPFLPPTNSFFYVINKIKFTSSDPKIVLRLFSVAFIGILSIWANHEASKGFEIHIENGATISPAGCRFQLLYVSNDKATRLVLTTSKFVETILYPITNTNTNSTSLPKKQVNRVTLRLAGRNPTHSVTVESLKEHDFVLNLSPSLMEEANIDQAMSRAVQQGMARVWLYDNAPNFLINGMVEYISSLAEFGGVSDSGSTVLLENDDNCWEDENARTVAHFLNYCEEHKKGFIQRLNQAMEGRWHDRTVDNALGVPAQHLCTSYMSRKYLLVESLESTSI